MTEHEPLRSLHDKHPAERDPFSTLPLQRLVEVGVARRARRRLLLADASAEASPPAGPDPTACVPDQFELLRRARDLVLDLKAVDCGYRTSQGTGPLPDGICKIDETAERGISVRQVLVTYE
jgi:hypothetical protein